MIPPAPAAPPTLDDLLALPGAVGGTKHPHKDVLCLSRAFPLVAGYGSSETAKHAGSVRYVKRQWTWDRRFPRWSDWRDGVSRLPDPVREWQGLRWLQALGLPVPTPLHLLRDDDPRSPRSAIVMSAVPVQRSLAEWLRSGDVARLDPFARRGLVVTLAEMADRIHFHRFRWRSMKVKHVYPEQLPGGDWRLWLIDCEGVRPHASRRQQRHDRRLLLHSLRNGGADAAFLSAAKTALLKPLSRTTARCRTASAPSIGCEFAVAGGR